jgi:Zn-dependent protease
MFGTGGNRFKVARIGGIPIYISTSWFLIAGLFFFLQYSNLALDVASTEAAKLAALIFVLFFGGILLHEAAHAIAARGFGLPVRAITLVFWGGATETRSWRKGALADFVVAAAGPGTTALLGLGFRFIGQQMEPGHVRGVMLYLGEINLIFAAFNAIPGFPLDGGRMLMATAWGITRKRALAFRIAGIGSIIVGAGFIVYAIVDFTSGNGGGLFLGYIGFVVLSVGRQIPTRAVLRERLQRGTARDAMQPIGAIIAADSSLLDATERYLRPFPDQLFPVQEGGRIVGGISLDDALDYAASTPVADATNRFDDPPIIEDTEPLDDVVEWIGTRDGLVTDITGRTVGMISVQDVDRWLNEHWSTGQYVERPTVAAPPRPDQR